MAVATLDLIPADYRDERRARRMLAWFVPLFALLLAGVGGARLAIEQRIGAVRDEAARLEQSISFNAGQQRQLETLEAERDVLARRVQILDGLRGGVPADRMFTAIDAAVDENTWFRRWTFRRRGDLTEDTPETVHAGYLIIVAEPAAGGAAGAKEKAWRLATHMEVAGSALDHTALAGFVERLLARGEIADVKILRTSSRREASREVIDFDLAITVYSAYEA